ncbi:10218_t:CDS:2, partial [Cetraspora pellucida]
AMSVVGVLQDDTDLMVSVMKLEKEPIESHADIGKILLAKGVANQTSATFLCVMGSELIQKNLRNGPKLVTQIIPCGEREIQRTMLELLNQLDGRITLSDDVDLEEFVLSKDDLSGTDIKAICT